MKYTVILVRPEYACENELWHENTYVASVDSPSVKEAIFDARMEAHKADSKDGIRVDVPEDYLLICVLEGECKPVAYGWQNL